VFIAADFPDHGSAKRGFAMAVASQRGYQIIGHVYKDRNLVVFWVNDSHVETYEVIEAVLLQEGATWVGNHYS